MGSKEDKEASKPVDGTPIFQAIDRAKKYGTKEEQESLVVQLKKGFTQAGKMFLKRALGEKLFTKQEWVGWQKEFGYTISDMGVVLQSYYGRVDGHLKPDKEGEPLDIFIITMPGSPIHKSRKMLGKRFGIEPITPKELNEKMNNPEFKKELKGGRLVVSKKLRECGDKVDIPSHPFNRAG